MSLVHEREEIIELIDFFITKFYWNNFLKQMIEHDCDKCFKSNSRQMNKGKMFPINSKENTSNESKKPNKPSRLSHELPF